MRGSSMPNQSGGRCRVTFAASTIDLMRQRRRRRRAAEVRRRQHDAQRIRRARVGLRRGEHHRDATTGERREHLGVTGIVIPAGEQRRFIERRGDDAVHRAFERERHGAFDRRARRIDPRSRPCFPSSTIRSARRRPRRRRADRRKRDRRHRAPRATPPLSATISGPMPRTSPRVTARRGGRSLTAHVAVRSTASWRRLSAGRPSRCTATYVCFLSVSMYRRMPPRCASSLRTAVAHFRRACARPPRPP